MARPAEMVDVAVAGAGVVGLAVALAIRSQAALPGTVLLCDPALAAEGTRRTSLRAVAIAADVRRFLSRLGVWEAIAPQAQPMTAMILTDSRVGAVPPPVFLTFDGEVEPGQPFAHMVLLEPLRNALLQACRARGVRFEARGVQDVVVGPYAVRLDAAAADLPSARLLVAADGGRSRLRDGAGLKTVGWTYGQSAIVATLAHGNPHGGQAIQHFLPGGPLALLPLRANDGSDHRTSLVWTERREEADRLVRLSEAGFIEALEARIGPGLGPVRLEDRPSATPLRVTLARSLVARRLALAGDAARTIHPLAGQGLNLGLRDAEALSRHVVEALDLGLDPGADRVLAAYQQARRPAAAAMAAMTDGLNRLFSNDSLPLRTLRDIGLGLVDRAPGLKDFLMREAAGRAVSSGTEDVG